MLVKIVEFVFHRIIAIALILAIGSGSISTIELSKAATIADLEQQISEKAEKLAEIEKKKQETLENLTTTSARGKTLEKEVQRIDNNIEQVDLNIRSSEVLIDKLGLEIVSLNNTIDTKELELERKRLSMSRIFQEYQVLDSESPLSIFLKNKTLAESVAETQVLQDLNNSLLTEMQELQQLQRGLNQTLGNVSEKKGESMQEAESLKAKLSIIESQKEQKASLLSRTKSEELQYQQQLKELEAQQQAIGQEIAQIEAALREAAGTDDLPIKVPGVLSPPLRSIYVTQNYGGTSFAQQAYSSHFHNGKDYRAAVGTAIIAAADGVVKMVGDNGQLQYGKYVMIDHGNNISTLYAHLSQHAASVGQAVKRGEVIGYSGSTGYSTGPHLHFGVYWTPSVKSKFFPGAGNVPVGITVNPDDYL